jgi:predicted transposase YbfD/YdcC
MLSSVTLLAQLDLHKSYILLATLHCTAYNRYVAKILQPPQGMTSEHGPMFFMHIQFLHDSTFSHFPMFLENKVSQRVASAKHLSWQIVNALPELNAPVVEYVPVPAKRRASTPSSSRKR